MNIASIRPIDVANGPGIRTSIFVSGCTHYCKECFNQEAWDFNYGYKFNFEKHTNEILEYVGRDYCQGLSILGGEPFHPNNVPEVATLALTVKAMYPDKEIWCYTGYLFEDLEKGNTSQFQLLNLVDVLVDGPFEIEKKDLSIRFRGSSNQRIIDVKESLRQDKIILLDEYM